MSWVLVQEGGASICLVNIYRSRSCSFNGRILPKKLILWWWAAAAAAAEVADSLTETINQLAVAHGIMTLEANTQQDEE